VGAIYIGPLKALINDQFMRLNDLCAEAGIPVWHWHGDVAQSHKAKMLKNPSGILQITPESLEALLLHKHAAVAKLFGDLRYVVIDEVHSLLRGDRGGQTVCLIERLSRMAGVQPRRIGLSATAVCIPKDGNIEETYKKEKKKYDVIIADECQFFTKEQIDALRSIVDRYNIPVLCFGLRTDFLTHLFPGSARLFEVADSIAEIKTICECGAKATVNARLNAKGQIVTHGSQVMLGGNDRYIAMCHKCWTKQIEQQEKQKEAQ
jgi:thymidine kinase